MRWSAEDDEKLRRLAAGNLTAEKISGHFGSDITRNSIIGRAHRIKVALRSRPGPSTKWTPAQDEELISCAKLKQSAGDISGKMKLPRLAVLGRARRIGIELHGRPGKKESAANKDMPAEIKKPSSTYAPNRSNIIPATQDAQTFLGNDAIWAGKGISLMRAGLTSCRWPLEGRSEDGQPKCCGEDISSGSYCLCHAAKSYCGVRWRRRHEEAA